MTIPLSPMLLIAAAQAYLGLGEGAGVAGSGGRGEIVDCLLNEVGTDALARAHARWDAPFVHHVGYWSHLDSGTGISSWPLPATASYDTLAAFAGERGVLEEVPAAGDLFLLRSGGGDCFLRTGIIVRVQAEGTTSTQEPWYECLTIEGNTDLAMSASGPWTMRHVRRFVPGRGDRFVRWTAIERSVTPSGHAGQPNDAKAAA